MLRTLHFVHVVVRDPSLAPRNQDKGRSIAQLEQHLLTGGSASFSMGLDGDIEVAKSRRGKLDKHVDCGDVRLHD